MKNSREKRKFEWEHLHNWGHERNRCLHIPMERIARGGIYVFIDFFFFDGIQICAPKCTQYCSVTMCTLLKVGIGLRVSAITRLGFG